MSETLDIEGMLRQALTPVEPPADFRVRFEQTLQNLTDIAADELEAWELGAMRDPRNWPGVARPVAAVAVGGVAGAALVVVRVRAGRKNGGSTREIRWPMSNRRSRRSPTRRAASSTAERGNNHGRNARG